MVTSCDRSSASRPEGMAYHARAAYLKFTRRTRAGHALLCSPSRRHSITRYGRGRAPRSSLFVLPSSDRAHTPNDRMRARRNPRDEDGERCSRISKAAVASAKKKRTAAKKVKAATRNGPKRLKA